MSDRTIGSSRVDKGERVLRIVERELIDRGVNRRRWSTIVARIV